MVVWAVEVHGSPMISSLSPNKLQCSRKSTNSDGMRRPIPRVGTNRIDGQVGGVVMDSWASSKGVGERERGGNRCIVHDGVAQ